MKTVKIETEYIKLEQFLKFQSLTSTGGEAKNVIMDGMVKVNGVVETARGKKLRIGDTVDFMGEEYQVI